MPSELGWPVKRLPPYVADPEGSAPGLHRQLASLSETLRADAQAVWDQTIFVNGTAVGAVVEGEHLRIVPQPVLGSGRVRNGRYPDPAHRVNLQRDLKLVEDASPSARWSRPSSARAARSSVAVFTA